MTKDKRKVIESVYREDSLSGSEKLLRPKPAPSKPAQQPVQGQQGSGGGKAPEK